MGVNRFFCMCLCNLCMIALAHAQCFVVDNMKYVSHDGRFVSVSCVRDSIMAEGIRTLHVKSTVEYEGKVYTVREIETKGFSGCNNVEEVVIDSGIGRICKDAFTDCANLRRVRIPSTVFDISASIFGGDPRLESIVVAPDNQCYDSRDNCNAIIDKEERKLVSACKNTVVPRGVEVIGADAFNNCYGLTSLTVTEGVKEIGVKAFENCKELRNIELPGSLKQIGWGAFVNTGIERISIPAEVDSIDYGVFSYCNNLTAIDVDKRNRHFLSYDGCNVIVKKKNKELICGCRESVIPNGVEIIGYNAFGGTLIRKVVIPRSVKEIAPLAFAGCNGLVEMRVAKDNPYFDSRDDCNAVIRTKSNRLLVGCVSSVIPYGITEIAPYAFAYVTGRYNENIPSTVKRIGDYAFYQNKSLIQVVLPPSAESIGVSAFEGCSSLETCFVYGDVVEIAKNAFKDCVGLRNIYKK